MGVRERQQAVRAMRGQMWSPGRPSTARREDRVRFWEVIARGASTEDASLEAGVSGRSGPGVSARVAGCRRSAWPRSRDATCRLLSAKAIAVLHAQQIGVREIARRLGRDPSTILRELGRNASTRTYRLEYRASTAQWYAERRASRPKVSKLAANEQLREYVRDRLSGVITRADGGPVLRARHPMDQPPPQPPPGSALGQIVEPGADRQPPCPRLPR